MHPGGWWGDFATDDVAGEPVSRGFVVNWLGGVAFIYGTTFAIGQFLFGNTTTAIALTLAAGIGFIIVWKKTISRL